MNDKVKNVKSVIYVNFINRIDLAIMTHFDLNDFLKSCMRSIIINQLIPPFRGWGLN